MLGRRRSVLQRVILTLSRPPIATAPSVRWFSGHPPASDVSSTHSRGKESSPGSISSLFIEDEAPPAYYHATLEDSDDEDSDTDPNQENEQAHTNPPEAGSLMYRVDTSSGAGPVWCLNQYHSSRHGRNHLRDQYEVESVLWGLRYWTASFVCPDTGAVYPAGRLREQLYNMPHYLDKDGRIVYRKRAVAREAAAARALDVIQYRELGVVEPRLCEEDPSVWEDSTEDGASTTTLEASTSSAKDMGETVDDGAAGTTENQEEELVLWEIPQSSGKAPSQRIVEALSSGVQPDPFEQHSTAMPTPLSPEQQLHHAINNAYDWIRQMRVQTKKKKSPHRVNLPRQDAPGTLMIAKILLLAMADAVQSIPVGGPPLYTEKAARKIVHDILWETQSAKPDADVYNSLLRCIESSSGPKAIAEKAEDIFNRMRGGERVNGHVLPKPNTETVNTIIQLWAQVGGTSGRYENIDDDFVPNRESFLSILSSAAYEPTVDGEVFGFDAEFARQCIMRMGELADDSPQDETMRPDTQVYNAPLRWSGGREARRTRSYARIIPWDDYAVIFKDGFRTVDEDDKALQDAHAMEAWMEEMANSEDARVAPNIETYEAVIQSFVRTGTRIGLERAESLANRLLLDSDDSAKPRLQTFHPILAAWVHAKDQEGAVEVREWIKRLTRTARTVPELNPDGRMLSWSITAQLAHQHLLLGDDPVAESSSSDVDGDIKEQVLVSATACSNMLKKVCDDLTRSLRGGRGIDRILEVTPFAHAVLAWSNVALVYQDTSTEQSETVEDALTEMVRIVDLLDSVIQKLSMAEAESQGNQRQLTSSRGAGIQEEREHSLQLRHILVSAPCVYSAFIIGLRRLNDGTHMNNQDESASTETQSSLFVRYMFLLERMLRRSGEFHEIESHDASLKMQRSDKVDSFPGEYAHDSDSSSSQRRMSYDDLFCYTPPERLRLPSREGFLLEVASFLKESPLRLVHSGDVMRLALLLRDVASQSMNRTEIETLVDELIEFALHDVQLGQIRVSSKSRFAPMNEKDRQHGDSSSTQSGRSRGSFQSRSSLRRPSLTSARWRKRASSRGKRRVKG